MEKKRRESPQVTHQSQYTGTILSNTQDALIPPDTGVVLSAQGVGGEEREEDQSLLCRIQLHGVTQEADILPVYQQTPVADLLRIHNLDYPRRIYTRPALLIATCMDYRIQLRLPDKFAFVLRVAGANLYHREFDLACALALAELRHVCLIGHTQCAMVDLTAKRPTFIAGLARVGGWDPTEAGAYFKSQIAHFQVADIGGFVYQQALRLRTRYPGVLIAPLLLRLEDGLLYQVVEGSPESKL